jgi:hypothetical protein
MVALATRPLVNTHVPPLRWVARNVRRDYYSDASGRFDLVFGASGWVAYDTERPGRYAGEDRGACERWCEGRANQKGVQRG